jgi:hypothetical protein
MRADSGIRRPGDRRGTGAHLCSWTTPRSRVACRETRTASEACSAGGDRGPGVRLRAARPGGQVAHRDLDTGRRHWCTPTCRVPSIGPQKHQRPPGAEERGVGPDPEAGSTPRGGGPHGARRSDGHGRGSGARPALPVSRAECPCSRRARREVGPGTAGPGRRHAASGAAGGASSRRSGARQGHR